jgi:hypothetical protein
MEKQQRALFIVALNISLSTTGNTLGSSCKVPNIFFSVLTKFGYSRQTFKKGTNAKFHENLTSEPCANTRGQTDMMKLIHAFRGHANVPKLSSSQEYAYDTMS